MYVRHATVDHVQPAICIYSASPLLHGNCICSRMQNCFICIFRFLPEVIVKLRS